MDLGFRVKGVKVFSSGVGRFSVFGFRSAGSGIDESVECQCHNMVMTRETANSSHVVDLTPNHSILTRSDLTAYNLTRSDLTRVS